jgi:hypothetical protein
LGLWGSRDWGLLFGMRFFDSRPERGHRRQLARLYAYGLRMEPEVVELIVRRTAGGSAALIQD